MPLTTVVNVSASQSKRPLCSCGWEGETHPDNRDAWREANAHARNEHGTTAGRQRTTDPTEKESTA